MKRVVVVGAGLSGLAAAYRIREAVPGVRLTVLEEAARPGGNIWTERRDGFTVEYGPNGVFDAKPHALRLVRDLGLAADLVPGSEDARKNRFLALGGRLQMLPGSPLGILTTPILSPLARLRLLAEPFQRRPGNLPADESVASFARRRFGREAADTFVDGLVTGIHGGDPEQLSLAAAFPRLATFERESGSVLRGMMRSAKQRRRDAASRGEKPSPQRMWSFRPGLRFFVEALAASLGASLKLGVGMRRLERTADGWQVFGDGTDAWPADVVVLTTPAHRQAELLSFDDELAALVAGIRSNRIAVVALGYRASDVRGRQDGFGFIAPQNTRRDVLGVQWCSSVFPERAPPGFVMWRALCGGVHRGELLDLSDDDLVRKVHAELVPLMGVTAAPAFVQVVRWPRAIPQYVVGHPARVAAIEAKASRWPGLILAGTGYRGVALNDCCEQAEMIARKF